MMRRCDDEENNNDMHGTYAERKLFRKKKALGILHSAISGTHKRKEKNDSHRPEEIDCTNPEEVRSKEKQCEDAKENNFRTTMECVCKLLAKREEKKKEENRRKEEKASPRPHKTKPH